MGKSSFGRQGSQLSMSIYPCGNLVYLPGVVTSQLSKPVRGRTGLAYLLQCNCGDYQEPRSGGNGAEAQILGRTEMLKEPENQVIQGCNVRKEESFFERSH